MSSKKKKWISKTSLSPLKWLILLCRFNVRVPRNKRQWATTVLIASGRPGQLSRGLGWQLRITKGPVGNFCAGPQILSCRSPGLAHRESFKICSSLIEGQKSPGGEQCRRYTTIFLRDKSCVNIENNEMLRSIDRHNFIRSAAGNQGTLKITLGPRGCTFPVSQLRRWRKTIRGLKRGSVSGLVCVAVVLTYLGMGRLLGSRGRISLSFHES